MKEYTQKRAEQLSYGQQKLVEIARCLATDSELILLDEPVAGINPSVRDQLEGIIKQIKKRGKTILFIEHDMKFVLNIAEKIIVLDHGKEIAVGTPESIKKNPYVLKAYIGEEI